MESALLKKKVTSVNTSLSKSSNIEQILLFAEHKAKGTVSCSSNLRNMAFNKSSTSGLIAAALSAHCGLTIYEEEKAQALIKQGQLIPALGDDQDLKAPLESVFYNKTIFTFDAMTGLSKMSLQPAPLLSIGGISVLLYWRRGSKGEGPEPVYYIRDEDLDPQYDYDFSNMTASSGENCTRGNYKYSRPYGWDRCALRVLGIYKDGNARLGEKGWRSESSPGEWTVSYHGTDIDNVKSIADCGYDSSMSKRQAFGPGIYSTLSVEVAEEFAARHEFEYDSKKYREILQNRVDLSATKIVPASKTGKGAEYFVTENDRKVRPYGVCLKQV